MKSKSLSDSYSFRMIFIFVGQYLNSSIVVILAYHSFWYSIDEVNNTQNNNDLFKGPYDDYNVRWYMSLGTQLIISSLMMVLLPYIGLVTEIPRCFVRCRDRRYTCHRRKTRQVIQSEYEKINIGSDYVL